MKVGRSTAYAVDTHAALKTGVHAVAASYLAKTSQLDQSLSDTEIPAAVARDAEVATAVANEATARDSAIATAIATAILQSVLTTRGDIIFRGASVAERLAKGTTGQVLAQGANDPAWGTRAQITSGSYTGTGAANKAIAHGFSVIPTLVLIFKSDGTYWFTFTSLAPTKINYMEPSASGQVTVTTMDTTSFYVGDSVGNDWAHSANTNGAIYYWVVIG